MDYILYQKNRQETKKVIRAFEKLIKKGDKKKDEYKRIVEEMKHCGQFHYYTICKGCGGDEFVGFSSCKIRYCVACSRKKMLSWLAVLVPYVTKMQERGNTFHMLVITVSSEEVLKIQLNRLEKIWKGLTNTIKENRKEFKRRFLGGIKNTEIKRGKKGWHAHYHIMLVKNNNNKDFEWLRDTVKNIDPKASVWVKEIKGFSEIIETIKYNIKPGINEVKYIEEMYSTIKGKRLISTFGITRGLKKQEEKIYNNYEDYKLKEYICSLCGCTEAELIKMLKEVYKIAC